MAWAVLSRQKKVWRKPLAGISIRGVQALILFAVELSLAWMCVASLLWIPFYFFADAVAKHKPTEEAKMEAYADVYVQIAN